jgi:ubiquinone biosynthesis accessory factor UbiJ
MSAMATQFPFSFLEGIFQNLPMPPAWAIDETQRRVVLMLNHVLMQEPQAMQRLARQSARVVLVQWRSFTFTVRVTPAGLLDLAGEGATPDLTLVLTEESPWALAQTLLAGAKPPVRIEGDVQLAAEVNWLADNVRWDVEEDLSRILGDAPSHMLVQAARKMGSALRDFLGRKTTAASDATDTSSGNAA